MDIAEQISRHLLDVYAGENWTEVNLQSTIDDLTYQEASELTPASINTISGLLHHLHYWNEVMAQRIAGVRVKIEPSNGFNNEPLESEAQWINLKQACFKSAEQLATAIRGLSEAQLQAPILEDYPTAYKSLQGSVEHVHYHLGQIVILKNLIRALDV